MKDCKICTDDGYKINREGYTLCKQHYEEVEDVFKQIDKRKEKKWLKPYGTYFILQIRL